VIHGFARVVGTNPPTVLAELQKILTNPPQLKQESPYGDGKASERIITAILKQL
jgi:UDP-N-acetylglucosamine 2-epimerase